jgi:hypothetical protein
MRTREKRGTVTILSNAKEKKVEEAMEQESNPTKRRVVSKEAAGETR